MKTKLLLCAALAAGSVGLAACSSSGSSTRGCVAGGTAAKPPAVPGVSVGRVCRLVRPGEAVELTARAVPAV